MPSSKIGKTDYSPCILFKQQSENGKESALILAEDLRSCGMRSFQSVSGDFALACVRPCLCLLHSWDSGTALYF